MEQIIPKRIQRKRTKGFSLKVASTNLNGVVVVTRPSPYGNPFVIGKAYYPGDSFFITFGDLMEDGKYNGTSLKRVTADNCLTLFRAYCEKILKDNPNWLEPLRGKDLACFCSVNKEDGETVHCHADILLLLANK